MTRNPSPSVVLPTATAAPKDRQFVTALARGLQILSCFTATRPELSGSDIAKLTGLPQPTVWRLCHTMVQVGTLVLVPGEKFRPGLAVLQLGHSAISGLNAIELARPHMQVIADSFGAACGMAVRNGLDMVFVERCEGKNQLLMNLRVGSTVPVANSALGWAYLCGLSRQERQQTINYITREDGELWSKVSPLFFDALKHYEKKGFTINAGVFHPAYSTIAVPIIAPDGTVPYTLNCGSAAATLTEKELSTRVAPQLIKLASSLRSLLAMNA